MKYLLFLFYMLSFSACAQGDTQQQIQEKMKESNQETQITDPTSIVKSLIKAMEANDAEKIRSLFSENASQAYGDGAPKSGKAFFSWLDSDIINRKGHVSNPEFKSNNNEVVVTGQYSSEGYTNKANFLFTVEDGEIKSWQMRY